MATSDWVKRRSLLVYSVLACAITWALIIPALVIAAKQGYVLPNPATFGELVKSGFEDGQPARRALTFWLCSGYPLETTYAAN